MIMAAILISVYCQPRYCFAHITFLTGSIILTSEGNIDLLLPQWISHCRRLRVQTFSRPLDIKTYGRTIRRPIITLSCPRAHTSQNTFASIDFQTPRAFACHLIEPRSVHCTHLSFGILTPRPVRQCSPLLQHVENHLSLNTRNIHGGLQQD